MTTSKKLKSINNVTRYNVTYMNIINEFMTIKINEIDIKVPSLKTIYFNVNLSVKMVFVYSNRRKRVGRMFLSTIMKI